MNHWQRRPGSGRRRIALAKYPLLLRGGRPAPHSRGGKLGILPFRPSKGLRHVAGLNWQVALELWFGVRTFQFEVFRFQDEDIHPAPLDNDIIYAIILPVGSYVR